MRTDLSGGRAARRPTAALLLACVLLVTAFVPASATGPAGAAAAPSTSGAAAGDRKIEPELARLLSGQRYSEAVGQDFWVTFADDLRTPRARTMRDWGERGAFVVDERRSRAATAQRQVLVLLEELDVEHTAYWVINAVRVEGGTPELAHTLAAMPDVERLVAPFEVTGPTPVAASEGAARVAAAVAWGVGEVRADQAWERYGVRGDGIVVGTIDSGAELAHPALVGSYRGNNHDGSFTHDHNWLDVDGGSAAPDDDNGHGTHVLGTIVGDDGGSNQVGVAPGATWIAANGCCPSDQALVDAAQWMLAPTDRSGDDPRPDLRPDVVNNSWGSTEPSSEPFIEEITQAWSDAGIFGVFANGNLGPDCGTSGTPGSRTANYSVGAYAEDGAIAPFSSRGAGQDGQLKPDIAAPGVDIRSSLPGGRYGQYSGTSMASPHVAGAVALLWSAEPALRGDVAGTRARLDATARDADDGTCGGTAADNNVYGEGRLDALTAVEAGLPEGQGTVTGTVTAEDGAPVGGAVLRWTSGDVRRSMRTGADGGYSAEVPAGDYTVEVSAFGFETHTEQATVEAGAPTTLHVELTRVPGSTVSGVVVDRRTGRPLPWVRVSVPGSPFADTTDARGRFAVEHVPSGRTYDVLVDGGGCTEPASRRVTVDGDASLGAIPLARVTDQPRWGVRPSPYGYSCVAEPTQWAPGRTEVARPEPFGSTRVPLPFGFTYFGSTYRTAFVDLGSRVGFETYNEDGGLRWGIDPHRGVGTLDEQSRILTRVDGRAPHRTFTIEFRDVTVLNAPQFRWAQSVTLHEDGDITLRYRGIDGEELVEQGLYSTVGLTSPEPEGLASLLGLTYSHQEPALDDARQLHFSLPPRGRLAGTVVDRRTGRPVPGAVATVTTPSGVVVRQVATDAAGRYGVELFTGRAYRVTVARPPGYTAPARATVRVSGPGEVARLRTTLTGGRFQVSRQPLVLRPGRAASLTIGNVGATALRWRAGTLAQRPGPAAGTELASTPVDAIALGVEDEDGRMWVSGADFQTGEDIWRLFRTDPSGTPSGQRIPVGPVAEELGRSPLGLAPGDLARVPSRGLICLSIVQPRSGDIACVDPDRSEQTQVALTFTSGLPEGSAVTGLAYDPHRDVFHVLGRSDQAIGESVVTTLAGVEDRRPGRLVSSCTWPKNAGGLAYNPASRTLYTTLGRRMVELDPRACVEVSTFPARLSVGAIGNGVGLDADGDLQLPLNYAGRVATVRTNNRAGDLPWLWVSRVEGAVGRRQRQTLTVRALWGAVPEGVTGARLVLRGNGAERPTVVVPIVLRR